VRPRLRGVRPARDDVAQLRHRVAQLVFAVVEVRPQPDAGIRPEVAHDAPLAELAVDGRGVGRADEHGAAAPGRVAGASDLAPRLVQELDQERRERERALADPLHPDLLDHVVARRRGVERRHVRRAGEKAAHARRVLELGLEVERARVALPADEGRLEPLGEVGPHVQPARPGAAAEPLDAAADGEVDVEGRQVDRDDPGRLVAVEDDVRARVVGAADDRVDVLDLAVLVEHVADRHEQRALVDRLHDRPVVLDRDDLEVGLRLVQVAHRGEVRLLVHDPVAHARVAEAGEHDLLRDGDVLVHDDRPRGRPQDPRELVAHRERQLPPALAPGADAALAPGAGVLEEPRLRGRRHGGERVVDQVDAVAEDRKPVAAGEELVHRTTLNLF
jgi:hypothetical protein